MTHPGTNVTLISTNPQLTKPPEPLLSVLSVRPGPVPVRDRPPPRHFLHVALEFELKAHLWEDVEIAGHVGSFALVEFDRIDVLSTVNIDDVREGDHADIT